MVTSRSLSHPTHIELCHEHGINMYSVKLLSCHSFFIIAYKVSIGTKEMTNTTLNHSILLKTIYPGDVPHFTNRYMVFYFVDVLLN